MAADPSYDAFIAQLERKHQADASGHNSYFEVFTETSRLIGQLKRGLNATVHRERQSEVRVAAQTWQDSCYNDRTGGSGVDILDWQPRFAHIDLSEGGAAVEAAAAAATAAATSGHRPTKSAVASSPNTSSAPIPQQRRSNTSPPIRRPGGQPPDAAVESLSLSGGPTAVERATSEPLTPLYRSGQQLQQQPYGGGSANTTQGVGSLEAVLRGRPGSPGVTTRAHRATDTSLLSPARRAAVGRDGRPRGAIASARTERPRPPHLQPPSLQQQQQQQQEAEEGDGDGETMVVTARERSFLVPQRLPPLDEPSGPLLTSPTSGSRVDEAIRVFARTAYEPGEHRHSLLLPPPGPGGGEGGGEGADTHHLERLPLAPVPRAVPRHVTEALAQLPAGIRGSLSLPVGEGRVSRESSYSQGPAAGAPLAVCARQGSVPDLGAVPGGGRHSSVSNLPSTVLYPQPPDDAPGGPHHPHPRPQVHRVIRPSGGSFTGPVGVVSPGSAVVSPGSGGGGTPTGGGDGTPPPPLLLPGRAARRMSAAGPFDSESPSCPASPVRVRAAAAAAAAAAAPPSSSRSGSHVQPPLGLRVARESATGGGGGGEAPGSPAAAGGLIRGYAGLGGGVLDYRSLDVVPRLALDAPRIKTSTPAPPGAVASPTAAAAPPTPADSHSEMRRGLAAAPAGLSNALHRSPRPGTAQPSNAASAPSAAAAASEEAMAVSGRFSRARRASCTGLPSSTVMVGTSALMPAPPVPSAASSSCSISLGPMLITREQVDSYMTAQAQGQAKAAEKTTGVPSGRARAAATGSARPGVNVIGTRGCLSDEPPGGPVGPRALRREVATLSDATAAGRSRAP